MNTIDKNYWGSKLPHPLSPNDLDVSLFKTFMTDGTTLLLGCTKKLIELSTRQLDLDPWYDGDTVIIGDWADNQHYYVNIIIDGGLCFNKELCDKVVKMASKNCRNFIARTFVKKLDIMRIADYFPMEDEFEIKPTMSIECGSYYFYIWRF
jgi:hypothetical protein